MKQTAEGLLVTRAMRSSIINNYDSSFPSGFSFLSVRPGSFSFMFSFTHSFNKDLLNLPRRRHWLQVATQKWTRQNKILSALEETAYTALSSPVTESGKTLQRMKDEK